MIQILFFIWKIIIITVWVVHYCSQKSYPNLNLPSLEVVLTTGLIFLSFFALFSLISPHFQQIRLGWAVVILSAIKASKGFKIDFTEQSTGVKVDFEGQDSFNGLSQTVKFFLEGLCGASSADFPSITAYLITTKDKKRTMNLSSNIDKTLRRRQCNLKFHLAICLHNN